MASLDPLSLSLLLLLGGWMALDAAAVGQFMLGRPLVAATLGGMVAGDPLAGALAGVLLEALHLNHIPAGGARLPDPGPGSLVAGVVAALPAGFPAGSRGGALALALTLGIGLSLLGGVLVARHRAANTGRVERALARGDALGSVLRRALAVGAVRGVGLVAVGLGMAAAVPATLVARWPLPLEWTVALVGLAAFLGLGTVARTPVPGGRGALLLVGGVAAGVALGVLFGLSDGWVGASGPVSALRGRP
jgi:mannose/fructose/N-acetylgalactosamine-specific phosphotransferase system component IIC